MRNLIIPFRISITPETTSTKIPTIDVINGIILPRTSITTPTNVPTASTIVPIIPEIVSQTDLIIGAIDCNNGFKLSFQKGSKWFSHKSLNASAISSSAGLI